MSITFDVDITKTVDSDSREFDKDTKSGFELYVKKCKEQSFASDFVSDITLAGHSSNGKESCGQWKLIGCLEHGLHKTGCVYCRKVELHCNTKGCNICFESAIQREAKAIKNRMMTFCNLKKNRKIYLKKENRVRILSHVTVSAPHETYYLSLTKDGRKELRQIQTKILKQLDVDGGVTINHPYRFTENLESAYLSPHFHNIITGWIDGNVVKQIYEQTGWVVKQISTMETEKDCYNLAKYLLSHSGVFEKEVGKRSSEHGVSYFGECQNRKFKVEEVLKYSVSGYEKLDKIINARKAVLKHVTKEEMVYSKTKRCFVEQKKQYIVGSIPLQQVHYTHSIIDGSVKDSTNEYFKSDVGARELSESLRNYIIPRKDVPLDNPALSQSEPMEFLQMRFDYGDSQYSIVQSEYLNIVFDKSMDELCPECSLKMQTLVITEELSPRKKEIFRDIIKSMPVDATLPFDDSMGFGYLRDYQISLLGMQYFDIDGNIQYESGVYSRPGCVDELNPKLYWIISRNIEIQKVRYVFKLENGRLPTKDEVEEINKVSNPKRVTNSQKITSF